MKNMSQNPLPHISSIGPADRAAIVRRRASRRFAIWALLPLLVASLAACGPGRDSAEEHRKLSLRIEHSPPGRAAADSSIDLHALVQSSLDHPRIEAWIRILGQEGDDQRVPLALGPEGEATATLDGRPKGTIVRYVVEAQDAAGLVVTLPRRADDGNAYELRFEGASSRVLGGISHLSAILAVVFWIGAGAAAAQSLRGRMSAGPAGMLGGIGLLIAILGLFLLGGIHATLVIGRPWPSSPLFASLSRGDLGLVALVWAANLVLGRRILLDEVPDGAPQGERGFSLAAAVAGVLTLLLTIW